MKLIIFLILFFVVNSFSSENKDLPPYYRDRGNAGIPTSMFGTYLPKRDFLIYPFYEFYWDHNTEYSPSEFGYTPDRDYEGKSIGHEGLIYLAYGFTDWLMLEIEIAVITETLWKASNDTSQMPDSIKESGLGDVEGQIRWRYMQEKERRPELFSFLEIVTPAQKNKNRQLIGTTAWEFKLGIGAVKGFKFGTMTARLAVEYDGEDEEVALGEYAIEYLKKIKDKYKLFIMLEGSEDELEFIFENQIHLNEHLYFKMGSGIGVTPKATDLAPEIGIMIRI